MDKTTTSCFLQQLAHWGTKYINEGRSLFRKIEITPTIITSSGLQTPDIVLWINQDSFVAGGFLLCPEAEQFDLDAAQACAQALGVRYFASWSAQKIIFWDSTTLKPHQELTAPAITSDHSIKPFEDTLIEMLDIFRTLAVLGTTPPEQLTSWHLANLCANTINKAQTTLSEHLRSTPQIPKNTAAIPINCAVLDKLHLVIARMLILFYYDCMPHNLTPENLDTTLCNHSSSLVTPQQNYLNKGDVEPALDQHSAVLIHHLFRRLGQVSLYQDTPRAVSFLQQILQQTAPMPIVHDQEQHCNATILVYSNCVHATTDQSIEIDTPPRLAIKHLIRLLMGWTTEQHSNSKIFKINSKTRATTLAGTLHNKVAPDTAQRNHWNTNIHLVWSQHRLELQRKTPTWIYEFIYLLGVMPTNAKLDLNIPDSLLAHADNQSVIDLLIGHFTLHAIEQQPGNMLYLSITKGLLPQQDAETIDWNDLPNSIIEADFNKSSTITQQQQVDRKKLFLKITEIVEIQGIPQFPQQYLYDFYRPQLTTYPTATTTWQLTTEFMGRYQLNHATTAKHVNRKTNDNTVDTRAEADDLEEITVDNEYLAHAIILVSHTDIAIKLPDDPEICRTILTRYLMDINDIHSTIWREVHAAMPHNKTANKLVTKIWQSLPLPPWQIVKQCIERFKISVV